MRHLQQNKSAPGQARALAAAGGALAYRAPESRRRRRRRVAAGVLGAAICGSVAIAQLTGAHLADWKPVELATVCGAAVVVTITVLGALFEALR